MRGSRARRHKERREYISRYIRTHIKMRTIARSSSLSFFSFFFFFAFFFLNGSWVSLSEAKEQQQEKVLWGLPKWKKPCVACTRDKGAWCDNGPSKRGCIVNPNFWNTLTCKRVVRCKKGCTPLRDMMEALCETKSPLCKAFKAYDKAKQALIGGGKTKK